MKLLILLSKSYKIVGTIDSTNIKNLRNNVSTDEIYPARYCIYYKNIGQYALTGDRNEEIKERQVRRKNINVVMGGDNFGCGSAREHAAITFKDAGVEFVFAKSFNKTFESNCHNNGIYTSTDFAILEKYKEDKGKIKKSILSKMKGSQEKILESGGLFQYNNITTKSHSEGKQKRSKAQNIAEKLISKHCPNKSEDVKVGDEVPLNVDLRFTYEVFAPLISELILKNKSSLSEIKDPESILFFEDHFVLNRHPQISKLITTQKKFSKSIHSKLMEYGKKGSGICHTVIVEDYVKPGNVIIGTDSHTGTSGVLNALCIPVGATQMAKAFLTKQIIFKIPKTIRINLVNKNNDIMAKDIVLHLFSLPFVQKNRTLGSILEFGGEGLNNMSIDEQTVFPNMTAEAGALTGIVEPNYILKKYMVQNRKEKRLNFTSADNIAKYAETINIDVSQVEPMIALPSDPKNVTKLRNVEGTKIDKAFIGSCTGGKWEDLTRAANILEKRKIKIDLYVHAASMDLYEKAKKEGIAKIFEDAGAKFMKSACGACIGQGPGSVKKREKIISATNRNYRGRMGLGEAYLSNPEVVAASAITGYITHPKNL